MKKASIVVVDFYAQNRLFDMEDKISNRDNCLYPFYLLKQEFLKHNVDLSTQDINNIAESEIIIYSEMPSILPDPSKINNSYLMIFESELIVPDNWNFKKHNNFRKIFTWKDDLVDNKKYFKFNFAQTIPKSINKDLSAKNKLCALIAGNKTSKHPLELYSKRLEAIKWFEKNHPEDFEFYGMGWDVYRFEKFKFLNKIKFLRNFFKYPSWKGKIKNKKDILEKYKFAICYENARDIPGYITEKIFDCFFAGCVPVYWGAGNVKDHIPEECFIDKLNFKTYEQLYDFMKNMNEAAYLNYLENIEKFLNSDKIYPFSAEYFVETVIKEILV